MLHLTEQAADMIADLVDDAGLPEGAGLRIAQRDDHPALAMTLAAEPGPEDEVVQGGSAAVFLGPVAHTRLEEQTLGARTGQAGAAFFLEP